MHWRGAVHDGTRWLLDPSRISHNYCELCMLGWVFTCFQPFDHWQCHHQQVGSGLVKVCYLKFYFSLTLYLVGIQCIGFKCSTTSRVLIGLKAAFVGSATEELPLPKRVFSVSLKRGIFRSGQLFSCRAYHHQRQATYLVVAKRGSSLILPKIFYPSLG